MERDLVVRARAGDREAFGRIVTAAIARLDAVARLIIRDRERARDAVQETLVRAWRNLPGLRDPDRFDAWLHRLLVRACIDELRSSRAMIELELDAAWGPSVDDLSFHAANRDVLERGFRRLTPEQRAVVVLHYFVGLSLAEIAETLHLPAGTARSRLHRAIQALRAAIDADTRTADVMEGRPA